MVTLPEPGAANIRLVHICCGSPREQEVGGRDPLCFAGYWRLEPGSAACTGTSATFVSAAQSDAAGIWNNLRRQGT